MQSYYFEPILGFRKIELVVLDITDRRVILESRHRKGNTHKSDIISMARRDGEAPPISDMENNRPGQSVCLDLAADGAYSTDATWETKSLA